MKRFVVLFLIMLMLSGCAGWGRSCSSWKAGALGADWIIVQYDYTMTPKHAWELHDCSVDNEPHSDGIYWKDRSTNNLVHISGWYNKVQVQNGHWNEAALAVGVDRKLIGNGVYPAK